MENLILIIIWMIAIWFVALLFGGGGTEPEKEKEAEETCPLCGQAHKKSKHGYGFFIFGKLPAQKDMEKAK